MPPDPPKTFTLSIVLLREFDCELTIGGEFGQGMFNCDCSTKVNRGNKPNA